MLSPEPTCLVIADITGYTGYLAGVELDHAQDILADLTRTVVGSLRPTFRLAKLEGDAAFAYVIAERIDGSALQDTVEGTYFAFRRRLRDIAQASTCDCNACMRMPQLDLKLVVHHGTAIRQRIAGREELVGPDVILVHRLLKNAVTEQTGLLAYALYTNACVVAMGGDPAALGFREHVETTDVAGATTVWLRDLHAAWEEEQQRVRVEVTRDKAYRVFEGEVAAPPALVWEYLTSPIRRPQWGEGVTAVVESSPAGRRGAGTVNHCMHGADAVVEEILDWRPPHYWTTRNTLPVPGIAPILMTDHLTPTETGTHVETRVARPRPRDRAAFDALAPMFEQLVLAAQAGLKAAVEADYAARAASPVEEVSIPVPAGRR